jgi:hypothetical protein
MLYSSTSSLLFKKKKKENETMSDQEQFRIGDKVTFDSRHESASDYIATHGTGPFTVSNVNPITLERQFVVLRDFPGHNFISDLLKRTND